MLVFYTWLLIISERKLYWLILLMTICSLGAEIIGTYIITAYRYRLDNIPIYIPLGHAVIYTTAYQLCRHSIVWRFRKPIEKNLKCIAFFVCFFSLVFLNDVGGFLCYLIFLILLATRKKPLFYLCMFFIVYFVEISGTALSTWVWYGQLNNHPEYPSTTIFPSGVAGLYGMVDIVCNFSYITVRKIIHRFKLKLNKVCTV